MPIIINEEYHGPMYPHTWGEQVHHICPDYYFKRYAPADHDEDFHNRPTNGLLLCCEAHKIIHSNWKREYIDQYVEYRRSLEKKRDPNNTALMSFEIFCEMQTYHGVPMWDTTWDVVLDAIATYNSVKFLCFLNHEHSKGPVRWYPFSVDSFIELRNRYKLLKGSKQLLDVVESHWEYLEKLQITQRWEERIKNKRPFADARKAYEFKDHKERLRKRIERKETIGPPLGHHYNRF